MIMFNYESTLEHTKFALATVASHVAYPTNFSSVAAKLAGVLTCTCQSKITLTRTTGPELTSQFTIAVFKHILLKEDKSPGYCS